MPANFASLNGTYAPTGDLVAGYPSFSAGPQKHLFRHSELNEWHLMNQPFDPAVTGCWAKIPAAGGPVPTGARAWGVGDVGNMFVEHEVSAREVA